MIYIESRLHNRYSRLQALFHVVILGLERLYYYVLLLLVKHWLLVWAMYIIYVLLYCIYMYTGSIN